MIQIKTLIKTEAIRWVRSGYILILTLGLSVIGYVSILSSYYLEDIIGFNTSSGVSITVPDPTTLSVFESYLKNFSQLGIILVVLTFAKSIGVGAGKSIQVYYAVRSRWSYRIYFPKIINSLFWSLFAVFISYLLIRYSIWALFKEEGFNLELIVLTSILVGVFFCLTLSAVIGIWSNSLLISSIIPILSVYVSSFLNSFLTESAGWLPSALLMPSKLLSDNNELKDYQTLIFGAILASLIFIIFTGVRPLRKRNDGSNVINA